LSDWLWYFGIPSIVISFLVIGAGLAVPYLAIRAFLKFFMPARSPMAGLYFGYFWVAGVLAIAGYLVSEFGYQLNFWLAPGIWGQPGKESTVWGPMGIIFPACGFAIGLALNALLEHRLRRKGRPVRIGIALAASLLLVATLLLSAWHGMQTLG
jgi:hypothetical protein